MNIQAWFQYFSIYDNFQAHYNLWKKRSWCILYDRRRIRISRWFFQCWKNL